MFSPDGNRVVTASFDETARIWTVAGPPLVEFVCSQLAEKTMTDDERQRFGVQDTGRLCQVVDVENVPKAPALIASGFWDTFELGLSSIFREIRKLQPAPWAEEE